RLLLLADSVVDEATVRQVLTSRPVAGASSPASGTLADRVMAFERETVLSELKAHGYRIADTARALGLERSHLYKKCQQLGIDVKEERAQACQISPGRHRAPPQIAPNRNPRRTPPGITR